jgi:hypothetical protein
MISLVCLALVTIIPQCKDHYQVSEREAPGVTSPRLGALDVCKRMSGDVTGDVVRDFDAAQGREAEEAMETARDLGDWLGELAVGRGVTVGKLLKVSVLGDCVMPSDWSSVHRVAVLLDLMRDVAGSLPDLMDRQIALVALNQYAGIAGGSPAERFEALRELYSDGLAPGDTSPVTRSRLTTRWRRLRREFGARILVEIKNRNENGWETHSSSGQLKDASDFQPFIVDRLEVTYFIDEHRVCTETITQRWITADLGESKGAKAIDHYVVRAKYSDVVEGAARTETEISPILNCRAGATTIQPDGWLATHIYFPEPLGHGGSVFFATRVRHTTSRPVQPAAFIQVTSLGIKDLIMRVQFHPSTVPSLCWVYGGTSVSDGIQAPRGLDRDRVRNPNRLGYVEHSDKNCPPGWFYTIGWKWDD